MRIFHSALTAGAVLLWAVAITGIWASWPVRVMCVDLAAASTVTMVAAVWLAVGRTLRDEDRRLLLLSVASLSRPRGRGTGPFPQAR